MMNSKRNERLKQLLWFSGGALCGLAMLSISKASIAPNQVTDDTAIYQNLSEIKVTKERAPNFDSDISRLSQMEGRYQEKLPGVKRVAVKSNKPAIGKVKTSRE